MLRLQKKDVSKVTNTVLTRVLFSFWALITLVNGRKKNVRKRVERMTGVAINQESG